TEVVGSGVDLGASADALQRETVLGDAADVAVIVAARVDLDRVSVRGGRNRSAGLGEHLARPHGEGGGNRWMRGESSGDERNGRKALSKRHPWPPANSTSVRP